MESTSFVAKKLLSQGGIYALQPFLQRIISFVLIPLYTAYLTPDDYGVLQYIMAFGQLALAIMQMGLGSAFWKFRSKDTECRPGEVLQNVFLTQIFIGLAILLLGLVTRFAVARDSPVSYFIVLYLAVQLISVVYRNVLLVLQAQFRAKYYVSISLCQSLLLAVLNIYLVAYLRLNYEGVIFASLISTFLLSTGFYYILCQSTEGAFNWQLSKKMIQYGVPIAVGNVAGLAISLSDRFFLKVYSGSEELGLYSFGYNFAGLTNAFLVGPFLLAWNPIRWWIYELDNNKEIFARFNTLLLILLPVLTLCIISGAVALGAVVTVNETFLIGFQITPIISFCYVFYGLFYFNQMGMLFENKTKVIMQIIVVAAVMNLILNYFLIPPHGMLGASIATVCSYLVMLLMGRYFSQRYYAIQRNILFELAQITLFLTYVFGLTSLYYYDKRIPVMVAAPLCIAVFHILVNLLFSRVFRRETRAVVTKVSRKISKRRPA